MVSSALFILKVRVQGFRTMDLQAVAKVHNRRTGMSILQGLLTGMRDR